jgi:hypothetical protein
MEVSVRMDGRGHANPLRESCLSGDWHHIEHAVHWLSGVLVTLSLALLVWRRLGGFAVGLAVWLAAVGMMFLVSPPPEAIVASALIALVACCSAIFAMLPTLQRDAVIRSIERSWTSV